MKVILKILLSIVTLIGLFLVNLVMVAGLIFVQDLILVPTDYILWVVNSPTYPLIFIIIGIVDYYIIVKLSNTVKLFRYPLAVPLLRLFKDHKALMVLLILLVFYIIFPNVTSFTEGSISHRTFYNPLGTEYTYEDVAKVEVGVYGESKLFGQSEGEYFYLVFFNDGTKVDLTNSGGENSDDTYSTLEYIDAKLMDLGVEKESSLDHVNLLTLDQYYIDRYVRIIVNK